MDLSPKFGKEIPSRNLRKKGRFRQVVGVGVSETLPNSESSMQTGSQSALDSEAPSHLASQVPGLPDIGFGAHLSKTLDRKDTS